MTARVPGEMSKTYRLSEVYASNCAATALSPTCSTCASSPRIPCGISNRAKAACRLPCRYAIPLQLLSNHAAGQINDWMNEIYERWSAAHGIILLTRCIGISRPARSS